MKKAGLVTLIIFLVAGITVAQRGRRGRDWSEGSHIVRTEGGDIVDEDTVRTAREIASHSTGTPTWTNDPAFSRDVFTFVRVLYTRAPQSPDISWTASRWGWITDFPDSDLNLSFRLQQVTSMRTDPEGRVLRLTDPTLFDYPWIYMVEPGTLELKEEEIPILRRYLLNGGVLWLDDFWCSVQWDNVEHELKRVLPERSFVELDMTNQIFHCVFDLKVPKNKLQTPNIRQGINRLNPNDY